jgi:hypothetical protein
VGVSAATDELDTGVLVEVRAALAAGASPATALSVARTGPLAAVARDVGVGRSLAEVAADVDTGDPHADLLVRGLGIVERTGTGAATAVEQVISAVADAAAGARIVRTRTAQARGSAVVLVVMPMVVWALLVLLDPQTLAFYGTPLGLGTAAGAALLVAAAAAWSRRMVRRAADAADRVDPLRGPAPQRDVGRALALGLPLGLVLLLGGQGAMAPLGALVGAAVGLRPRGGDDATPDLSGGGTAEVAELIAVALGAGGSAVSALADVAAIGPPAARAGLTDATRRLRGGWSLEEAFDGTRLEAVGDVLAATARWGAPAAPALRQLAADLRAARRDAAEEAAERLQLSLIFPTTLLTLPAFVLGVVPPVLWTALRG